MKFIVKIIGSYLNVMSWISPKLAGKHAFLIFCTPFSAKLKDHHNSFLDTAEHLDMDFQGKRIQRYKWGQGPQNILMVHGWQSNTFRWKKLIERIDKSRFTIHAIDAPAHGRSDGKILNVPIYSEALSELVTAIGQVDAFVCHSIGGFASLHMMHHKPELKPDKAVFMAAPGNAEEFIQFFRATLGANKRSERYMRAYFKEYTGKDVKEFQTSIYVKELGIAGLIIHDEEDQETAVAHSKKIHSLWPESELILTKGLGHKLKSQKVEDAVIDFLLDSESNGTEVDIPVTLQSQN